MYWGIPCPQENDENYRFVSIKGEVPFSNYFKIDNTILSPETVAQMIKKDLILNGITEDLDDFNRFNK